MRLLLQSSGATTSNGSIPPRCICTAIDEDATEHDDRPLDELEIDLDVMEEVEGDHAGNKDGQRRSKAFEHIVGMLDYHCYDLVVIM